MTGKYWWGAAWLQVQGQGAKRAPGEERQAGKRPLGRGGPIWTPFLLLSSCVTLGKPFNFPTPVFLSVQWGYRPITL